MLLLALKTVMSKSAQDAHVQVQSVPLGCSEDTKCSPSLISLGKGKSVECGLTQLIELTGLRVLFIHTLSLLRKESGDGFQPVPVRGQCRKNRENLVQGPGSGTEVGTDVKHSG